MILVKSIKVDDPLKNGRLPIAFPSSVVHSLSLVYRTRELTLLIYSIRGSVPMKGELMETPHNYPRVITVYREIGHSDPGTLR